MYICYICVDIYTYMCLYLHLSIYILTSIYLYLYILFIYTYVCTFLATNKFREKIIFVKKALEKIKVT